MRRPHRLIAAAALLLVLAHLVGGWYGSPILPAAAALAWFAAAGYALLAPDLEPRTRGGLAVALAALGIRELLAGGDAAGTGMAFTTLPPHPGSAEVHPGQWLLAGVAGVALVVAVAALPERQPDRRRNIAALALGAVLLALALLRSSTTALPSYVLLRGPADVLPAYALLAGLAVVALLRTGSTAVVAGLVLAALAALDLPWSAWWLVPHHPSGEGNTAYLSLAFTTRVDVWPGSDLVNDVLWFLGAALVLAGSRRVGRAYTRARGAVRPRS